MPNIIRIPLEIENFPAQQSIFDATQKYHYVIVPKGRRFGVTTGASNFLIEQGLTGGFSKCLWGDVVNSNIEKYIQRLFMPELRKLPDHLWKWQRDPHVIYIKNSYIDFRSAERPESWEGFGYDFSFLNEAGIILKNKYLWQNAIRPMFWDYNCRVVVAGTPKGKGEFYTLYQRGLDPTQKDYISMKFTPFDNPFVSHDRIREDMKDMSELAIKQEIYAEFLDESGIVFRGITNIATLEPREPELGHIYVVGVDLAKLVDFTVIAVYDRTDNHQVFQMRFNKLEYPFIKQRIKEVSFKYNRALVMLDSTGSGEPVFDDLRRFGIPVEGIRFTNEIKKDLINKLANWIELRNLSMLCLDETINEFNSFTYDFSEKTDRVYYGAPPGFHDDIVIAHALACWSLQPVIPKIKAPAMSAVQRDILIKKLEYDNYSNEGNAGDEEYEPAEYF